jgi:diguanylate cyclase (GGDEF)-like protein/putative nucleotidyltransferase with HDIG domain
MDPPLRERLSWRNSIEESAPASPAAMALAGAVFAAAAGIFAFVSVAIPDAAVNDERLLAAMGAAALVTSAVLLIAYDRIPMIGFHVAAALGIGMASVAVYAWGVDSGYAPLPYVWVALGVFYFFPLRSALGHLTLLAIGYAVALVAEAPSGTVVDGWIATVGTLLVTGVFVALVRDRLAGLIANLTDAARRDPLTDLFNRRAFEEIFDIELERARRTGAPLSVVVGDLDRFKQLNDEFGHQAGDEALRRIGRSVRTAKRRFDSAARVGGEEFALLAPDCDEHGAYMLSERIRSDVESNFANGGDSPLTVSFGIATYPLHGQSAETLLRAADQALYAAKRLGRNRSVISSAEVPGILARTPRTADDSGVELATLLSLAEALDLRDTGNTTHCHRVGRFAELTARELGMPPETVERIRLAGILHDVGRVGMPDSLFQKAGPLNDAEWTWVHSHPEIGARMVETTDFQEMGSWILCHHERPDGQGYPLGRPGDEVPLEARILAVADAYEAMTSERSYRPALAPDQAATELRRGAGQQFDGRVVDALLSAL